MILDAHASLEAFLRAHALGGSGVSVAFEVPGKAWAAARKEPAVNCFLYDVRENQAVKHAGKAPERRHSASRVVMLAGPPLDSPAIMQGVRPRIPAIRACLDGVRANVSFSLDIDARGHVRSVNLMSPPASSPAGRCVSRVLARLSYPLGHPTANARLFFTP